MESPIASPTLKDIVERVDFNTDQVARLCGVSRRQLGYWVQQGIVQLEGTAYTVDAIEKVVLIRRQLQRGRSLRQAVQFVERYLARRETEEAEIRRLPEDQLRTRLDEQLARLQEVVGKLRQRLARHPDLRALAELRCQLEDDDLGGLLSDGTGHSLNEKLIQLKRAYERLSQVLGEWVGEG